MIQSPRLLSRVLKASFVLSVYCMTGLCDVRTCQASDLSGYWSGTWASSCTRHHGPLSATFCRLDETHYRVNFRGRFFKILPFHYSVTLAVVGQEGDTLKLSGSSYLGRLFGTFYYQADVTPTNFVATYWSCKDRGRFLLSRCCVSSSCK